MENNQNQEGSAGSQFDFSHFTVPEGAKAVPDNVFGADSDTNDGDSAASKGQSVDAKSNPYSVEDEQEVGTENDSDQEGNETQEDSEGGASLKDIISVQVKSAIDPKLEIPDDINEDNFATKLIELGKKTVHPEALSLHEYLENGGTLDSYIKSFTQYDEMLKLDDKELVKRHLRHKYGKNDNRPDGWDEQKIQDRVDKMSEFDLEERAEDLRKYIAEQKRQRMTSINRENRVDYKSKEFQEMFEKSVNETFKAIKSEGTIYGLKFASDKHEQKALARVREILAPDERGTSKFVQALGDPKEAMKIALLWDMLSTGAIKLDLKSSLAATKGSLSQMLSKRTGTSKTSKGSDKVDFSHFARPAF